eukprot:NODE_155_length_16773_cov_0.488785.p14 type:complete len:111 gc:universal NODE_155_length_16773_cov_0.488785:7841-7509(-)
MYRLIQRVKNLREDCHMKICDYLTKTYDLIYLPSFNTSQMISSLSSKVARNLATMSHYAFKERLKFKCKQRGKTMVECNESFTSQTYTRCGTLKKANLETYTCTVSFGNR